MGWNPFKEIKEAVTGTVSGVTNAVSSAVSGTADFATNFVEDAADVFYDAGKQTVESAYDLTGFDQAYDYLIKAPLDVVGEGIDAAQGAYNYYTGNYDVNKTLDNSAYGEADVEYSGKQKDYYQFVKSSREASEHAVDFRQDQYASYRDKYLQHSSTALGTSNTASRGVVIG